jgi:hypothetical protein
MHPPANQEPGVTEVWGDGHTHSNWSDGYDPLATTSELFRRYDQDYHFACDHILIDVSDPGYEDAWNIPERRKKIFRLRREDIPAYQAEVHASSRDDHVAVDGLELTWMNAAAGNFGATDRHHVLVRDHIDRLPELEFFRGKPLRAVLLELKERGMRPFLAHIDDAIPPDGLDGSEIDGVEIRSDIERRGNPLELVGVRTWDTWLSRGHRVALSGGSDSHQMDLWAGSGVRTVTRVGSVDRESIRDSLLSGRGYISSTWHPDLYLELGFDGIDPASGGFTPWWRMLPGASMGSHDRDQVRALLEKMTSATITDDRGRTARTNYPTITFAVDGSGPGTTASASDQAPVQFSVSMTVPVRTVRLIAHGETVWQESPTGEQSELVRDLTLSVSGYNYLRLEAHGVSADGRHEYVMTNPVYLQS